jgi:hypothetical protein
VAKNSCTNIDKERPFDAEQVVTMARKYCREGGFTIRGKGQTAEINFTRGTGFPPLPDKETARLADPCRKGTITLESARGRCSSTVFDFYSPDMAAR